MTTNEQVNGYRYAYLRSEDGSKINPFNEGCWRNWSAFCGLKKAKTFGELNLRTDPLTEQELAMVRGGCGHNHGGDGGGHGHSHGGGGSHGHSHGGAGHGHSHGGAGHGHSHGGAGHAHGDVEADEGVGLLSPQALSDE